MSETNKHFEKALISLRRTYGKDELVASLLKKLSDAKIELGKTNSYIEELEEQKENLIQKIKDYEQE